MLQVYDREKNIHHLVIKAVIELDLKLLPGEEMQNLERY